MSLNIRLQVFEGPLDLLLYLIEKNKVNIYDIPIVSITDQYMEYVKQIPENDLDLLSEFLVMAATLVDIKAQLLLPENPDEDEAEEDPRADLVRQLLEYKMYKAKALELRDMSIGASRKVYREPMIPDEVKKYVPPLDLCALVGKTDLEKLNQIFQEVLKRQSGRLDPIRSKFGNIRREEISLDRTISRLEKHAKQHGKFSFRKLLETSDDKEEVIVTFLAVLELMKVGKITISQEKLFDDIIIKACEDKNSGGPAQAEKNVPDRNDMITEETGSAQQDLSDRLEEKNG